MAVRTRFAPSPTGYLHVGGARTALFSWLYAKKHNGQFILRIEDTDRERSTDAAVRAILDGMEWLGLQQNEGPFYQTKRFDRYSEIVQQLLDSGHAYRCYCSKERLDQLREEQLNKKQKPRYDRACLDQAPPEGEAAYVIRFNNPCDGEVVIDDQILGKVVVQNSELDDLIIMRSDGTPTYNLTVVVDDLDMQVSHVIRGNDHLNNTARQMNMLKALGGTPPKYAHVPMILGNDGKRLSKRHGAVSVLQYREDGFLPQALLNYLVRLGWSYGDQEVFSIAEMINLFDITDVNKSAAAFDNEKLIWLNQHYIKNLDLETIAHELNWHMQQAGIDVAQGPSLEDLITIQRDRAKTLKEMVEQSHFFYTDTVEYDPKASAKHLKAELREPLNYFKEQLEQLSTWQTEELHKLIVSTAEKFDLKMGKIAQPIRVAVTGNTVSPSIDKTLFLIGKQRVLQRLSNALELTA